MDIPSPVPPVHGHRLPDPVARRTAQAFETAFLAEMLRSAGMARMPVGLPGSQDDEHFASFLAEAQARALVAAGGLGLADAIARTLEDRQQESAR